LAREFSEEGKKTLTILILDEWRKASKGKSALRVGVIGGALMPVTILGFIPGVLAMVGAVLSKRSPWTNKRTHANQTKKERRERHDTCGGHWICLAACWFLPVQRSAVSMEILDFVLLRWAFAEVQVCAAVVGLCDASPYCSAGWVSAAYNQKISEDAVLTLAVW